jgi:hypothetical protein
MASGGACGSDGAGRWLRNERCQRLAQAAMVNPGAFPAVDVPTCWASKGIYGERIWLQQRDSLSSENRRVLRLLVIPGAAGIALVAWGLIALDVWPTVFGAKLVVLAQLWRIDRLVRVYDDTV